MLEGFSWLRANSEAYCVTFAQELDTIEMLRRFDADPSWARLIQPDDWQAQYELSHFGQVIRVGQCDGWTFVHEDNGYRGTLPEVLQAVSADTVAVSVFRNINAVTRFCYAEDGTIIANFEPFFPLYSEEVADPRLQALLRLAGIPEQRAEDDYDSVETMFALAEAAGVRLTEEAIAEQPLLCSIIRNPFADFVGDLLNRGADEQTTDRLLALLGTWEPRERFLGLLNAWQQGTLLPRRRLQEKDEQPGYLYTVTERILSELQSVHIIPPLLKALTEGNERVRSAASQLLKILLYFDQTCEREGAQERYLQLTTAPDLEIALQASIALGKAGDQRAIEPLLRLLPLYQELRYPGRREIIPLLGQLRASSALEPLLNMLDSRDDNDDRFSENIQVQRDVINALEQIEGARIVERLLPLLNAESQTIAGCSFQQGVLATLARQGDQRILEPLLKLLNPHPKGHYSYDFQLRLLEALGNLGEQQAIEPLAQLLALDPSTCDTYARIFQQYLIKTLRQLGDTRAELDMVEAALQRLAATTKTWVEIRKLRHDPPRTNN